MSPPLTKPDVSATGPFYKFGIHKINIYKRVSYTERLKVQGENKKELA